MINKNLIKIIKNLDQLDNKFLDLIKKRTMLVNKVIKTKKYKSEIIDKKRISVILRTIKAKSKKKKIDPVITKTIWSSMIKAYIAYEFRNFKK